MKLTRAELAEAARDASTHVVKGTLLSDEAVLRLARAVLELMDVHDALSADPQNNDKDSHRREPITLTNGVCDCHFCRR